MIKNTAYYLIVGLMFLCASCEFEEDQLGLPRIVTFPKEGGEKTFKAECDLTSINIKDKVGNKAFLHEADGLGVGIYKWLTVKAPLGDYLMFQDMLTIIVEPNTSGKSRKLYVHFDSGWKYGVIEVKQE